jgi:hypothetical protein
VRADNSAMADKSLFTANEVWKGGSYELFMPTESTKDLCSLSKALWTFPSLDGCYLRQDREPAAQPRVPPCENGIEHHLYGLVTLPNQCVVPCASYVMDYAGEVDSPPAHWISFGVTMCALSTAYPVGAYPFGPMDKVSEWKAQVDSLLTELARWVHGKMPLAFALVGFEVDTALSPAAIRANGIPKERDAGILWNDGAELTWYPATRP